MRCPFGRLWYGEPDAVSNAVGYAKFFSRAGQPGWAAIIPIVNTYFVCKVAGRPGCVPVVLLYTIRRAFSFAAACGAFVWIAADVRHELGEQTCCARSCVQRRGDATRDRLFS